MLPSLQSAAIAFGAGMVLSIPLTWYITAEYKDALHTAAISQQKAEAAKVLQQETEKLIAAERRTATLKDQLEIQHAKSLEQVNQILADNKRLADQLGWLRDPGRRPGRGDAVPAAAQTAGRAPAAAAESRLSEPDAGLLSPEAGTFLLEFAAGCDRAAVYAQTAHDWAMKNAGADSKQQ